MSNSDSVTKGGFGADSAGAEGETLPRWKRVRWTGAPDGSGPEIEDVPQMIQLIMLGRTIAILPRSLVEPVPPGLICVPVIDATASQLVIAWSQLNRRPLIASFVEAAVTASISQSIADEKAAPIQCR